MTYLPLHRFRVGIRGRCTAFILFVFLLTQDISDIAPLRAGVEAMLFFLALWELNRGVSPLRQAAGNVVARGVLAFILSVLFACLYSPNMAVSFSETWTPVFKGMLLVPLAFALCVARLFRLGWSQEDIARLIILAVASSGLALVAWTLASYFQVYLKTGTLPQDLTFHRYKVNLALVALPFALLGMGLFKRGSRLLMVVIVLVLMFLIVTSAARAAWLGGAAAAVYLMLQLNRCFPVGKVFNKWHFVGIATVLVATYFGLSETPIAGLLKMKILQGFDSSGRFGNGVWGATLDLIRERPWLGYGYGDEIYSQAYNALAKASPSWMLRESIGAHNVILAHWAAAGVIGLAAILFLYATFIHGIRKLIRVNTGAPFTLALLHGSLAALIATYLVRGQFEIVRWNAFGMLLAIVVWLFLTANGSEVPTPSEEACPAQPDYP